MKKWYHVNFNVSNTKQKQNKLQMKINLIIMNKYEQQTIPVVLMISIFDVATNKSFLRKKLEQASLPFPCTEIISLTR